jgi:hemoglobin-like flavoprotein
MNHRQKENDISSDHKQLIIDLWKILTTRNLPTEDGGYISVASRIFQKLGQTFFQSDPGKKLFHGAFTTQCLTLAKFLKLVVGYASNETYEDIQKIAAHHLRQELQKSDYHNFIHHLSMAIEETIEEFTSEVKRAWENACEVITASLLNLISKLQKDVITGLVSVKIKRYSSWKKLYFYLTLNSLILFRDEKYSKQMYVIPLSKVIAMENLQNDENSPTNYGFTLILSDYQFSIISFCSEIEYGSLLKDEISWRVYALTFK